MSPKLGQKLRSARISLKLTTRDVARLSQGRISNSFVSQIELGYFKDVSPAPLRALADVLKLSYLELMILAGHLTVKDLKGKV